MNNYKIKVNNEPESKEAQDLFEQLGFMWAGDYPENGDWYSHLYAEKSSCCHLPIYVWNGLGDKFQEITLPQLRDIVSAHRKPTEQGLISGTDAKLAWAKGEDVEFHYADTIWAEIPSCAQLSIFDDEEIKFRLKPSTITLNVEIPAPFEPKEGEEFFILAPLSVTGYTKVQGITTQALLDEYVKLGAWRTEEQVKQVVAALRGGIKA